jgi:hypothetical protein
MTSPNTDVSGGGQWVVPRQATLFMTVKASTVAGILARDGERRALLKTSMKGI